MGRVHTLPPLKRTALRELVRSPVPAFARLSEGHEPHGQRRYLWTDRMPPDWAYSDALTAPIPALDLVAVPEVQLRSDWMAHKADGAIAEAPLYPGFVRDFYDNGLIDMFGYPTVTRRRRVRRPTYVVTHFNMRTYGHFLLEVLPKLLMVEQLYAFGLRYPVAFPRSTSGLVDIVRAACPTLELRLYDDTREALDLPLGLFPTNAASGGGHLHDVAISQVKLLALRLGVDAASGRRLFLVRAGWESFRVLENEPELAAIAVEYGFECIRPERLPWAEQVATFAAASHVVGEFTSAIHNTLFCSAAAKVVCLNWLAGNQSSIAEAAGHEIGYIMPQDGVRTTFQPGWTEPQRFSVDPALFRERLEQIGLRRL